MAAVEIGRAAHDADVGKFRLLLAREMREDARAQRHRRLARLRSTLICTISAAVDHAGPARLGVKLGRIEPGLFLELAPHAEFEIDLAADDVVGSGVPEGK